MRYENMTDEKKLEVTTKTTPKGTFQNINLKEKIKVQVGDKMITADSDFVLDGGYIVVEKVYPDGQPRQSNYAKADGTYPNNYSCKVNYAGEEVSFWLDERQHEAYKVLGDVGSKIKVIGAKVENTRGGKDFLNLSFELVQ